MSVDQQGCPGHETGIHAEGLLGIDLDEDEAVPGGAVALGFGTKLAEKGLFELEDFFHVHAGDERLGGSGGGVGEQDIFEFVAAGGDDGGALVDLGRVEKVEDGEVLDEENFVHAFEAKSALLIEEIRDMGLFESGLLGQMEPCQLACLDTVQEDLTKIILQDFEPHRREYSTGLRGGAGAKSFPQVGYVRPTLTEKIHSFT